MLSGNYLGMRIICSNSPRSIDIVKVRFLTFAFYDPYSNFLSEYAQAVDFVDRALFAYERAFVGAFNFTTGINRLDFDRVENRPFFLAVHRQISLVVPAKLDIPNI